MIAAAVLMYFAPAANAASANFQTPVMSSLSTSLKNVTAAIPGSYTLITNEYRTDGTVKTSGMVMSATDTPLYKLVFIPGSTMPIHLNNLSQLQIVEEQASQPVTLAAMTAMALQNKSIVSAKAPHLVFPTTTFYTNNAGVCYATNGTTTQYVMSGFRPNVNNHVDGYSTWTFGNISPTLNGISNQRVDGSMHIIENDITLNTAVSWDSAKVQKILEHEMTHGIGLGDVNNTNQIMYFSYANTSLTPGTGDIQGMNLLYGAGGYATK